MAGPDINEGNARTVLTVSELNHEAKLLLERGLARLWVEGEVSNLARPASGHLYFSLKDAGAQIRCAWFRQRQQRVAAAKLANGERLVVYGRVSLYEPRGDYQLIVERAETSGEGELLRRFEALKKKLLAEGLFDDAHKRPLPDLPSRIGLITSPSGAAVRDMLTVLARRFPAVPVLLYPASVQGAQAVPDLVAALDAAARREECDLLIIGRGGGSLEDLWAFNEEPLARAIRRSPIPVISAVGHEVDFTIADLVADCRAPTPSGAAELAVPDQSEWQRGLDLTAQRLIASIGRTLETNGQSLDWLTRRLDRAGPGARLDRHRERLLGTERALSQAMRSRLTAGHQRLERLNFRLQRAAPAARVERLAHRLSQLRARLAAAANSNVQRVRNRLAVTARALDTVSPLATLERGYAIVTDKSNGRVLTDTSDIRVGSEIEARLDEGRLSARVTSINGSDS